MLSHSPFSVSTSTSSNSSSPSRSSRACNASCSRSSWSGSSSSSCSSSYSSLGSSFSATWALWREGLEARISLGRTASSVHLDDGNPRHENSFLGCDSFAPLRGCGHSETEEPSQGSPRHTCLLRHRTHPCVHAWWGMPDSGVVGQTTCQRWPSGHPPSNTRSSGAWEWICRHSSKCLPLFDTTGKPPVAPQSAHPTAYKDPFKPAWLSHFLNLELIQDCPWLALCTQVHQHGEFALIKTVQGTLCLQSATPLLVVTAATLKGFYSHLRETRLAPISSITSALPQEDLSHLRCPGSGHIWCIISSAVASSAVVTTIRISGPSTILLLSRSGSQPQGWIRRLCGLCGSIWHTHCRICCPSFWLRLFISFFLILIGVFILIIPVRLGSGMGWIWCCSALLLWPLSTPHRSPLWGPLRFRRSSTSRTSSTRIAMGRRWRLRLRLRPDFLPFRFLLLLHWFLRLLGPGRSPRSLFRSPCHLTHWPHRAGRLIGLLSGTPFWPICPPGFTGPVPSLSFSIAIPSSTVRCHRIGWPHHVPQLLLDNIPYSLGLSLLVTLLTSYLYFFLSCLCPLSFLFHPSHGPCCPCRWKVGDLSGDHLAHGDVHVPHLRWRRHPWLCQALRWTSLQLHLWLCQILLPGASPGEPCLWTRWSSVEHPVCLVHQAWWPWPPSRELRYQCGVQW